MGKRLFILILFCAQNHLTAQTLEHSRTGLVAQDSLKTYSSNFAIQMMKFRRLLRNKYAFADSISGLATINPEYNLNFKLQSRKMFDYKKNLPSYPELYRPFYEEELQKRASGGSTQFLINPVQLVNGFKKKAEWEKSRRAFHNNFIPNNLQLNVLRVLWDESLSTQIDLYLGIDKSIPITAKDLDKQLKRMVDLGLLERKIISPQNPFTLVTPLKAFQIEKSAANRKNRVYLYRARVGKKVILQFLLTRYSRVKDDGIGKPGELDRLRKKLKIVLEDKEG